MLVLTIAEIPSMPPNAGVSPIQPSEQTSQILITNNTFSLAWEEPENIEHFDLEYFQISVFMSLPSITGTGQDIQYSVNATTTGLNYHFVFPMPTVEYIMVTAISKCSDELSLPAIWTNSKSYRVTGVSSSGTVWERTDQASSDFINGMSNNLILLFIILYKLVNFKHNNYYCYYAIIDIGFNREIPQKGEICMSCLYCFIYYC